LLISFFNFEVHGPPRPLRAPGRRPGCSPLSWGLAAAQ